MRNHVKPKPIRDLTKEEQERFEKRTVKQEDGCWIWGSSKFRIFSMNCGGEWIGFYPHRISWKLYLGEDPESLMIERTCKNKLCIAPTHLKGSITPPGALIKQVGKKHHKWKGCGELGMAKFSAIRRGTISRGIEFEVTIEYLWALFLEQNRTCALTGLPLAIYKDRYDDRTTASLDRKDARIGYTKENVQWVHREINLLKRDYSQEFFIMLCRTVSKAHPGPIISLDEISTGRSDGFWKIECGERIGIS